jgi:hypothetical protein
MKLQDKKENIKCDVIWQNSGKKKGEAKNTS